jgi:hypothetical protein
MDLTNIFFTDIDILQIEQALKLNKKLLPMDFYKLIKEDQMEELLMNPLNWVGEIFSRLNK